MQTVIQGLGIAAILTFVAGANIGCSGIGYLVGGAIDGVTKYELDSVSVAKEVDSAGVEHRSWEGEHLKALVKEASPGKGSRVEVITRQGSCNGDALTLDTVFAVEAEPSDTGSEGLLPGELVRIKTREHNLTQGRRTVLGLRLRTILLRVDGEDRGYPPDSVNAILLSDKRILSGTDLALPSSAGRFIRVPGLVLGQEAAPLFIPLWEVQWIGVRRPVEDAPWGTGRIIGVAVGGAVDIAAIIGFIAHAIPFPKFFGNKDRFL